MSGPTSPSSDGPEHSPALLAPPPRRGVGVRRLNRVPILFVVGGAMLVVLAVGYTYRERFMQATANTQAEANRQPEPANGADILDRAPPQAAVPPALHPPVEPVAAAPAVAPAAPSDARADRTAAADDAALQARQQAWQGYYAQLEQLRRDRVTTAQAALTSETNLGTSQAPAGAMSGVAGTPTTADAGQPAGLPGQAGTPAYAASGAAPGGFGTWGAPPAQTDATGQREKQAFLSQPGDTSGASDDLPAALRDPASPFLVMAGTVIPAVMVGGINSDMPGMVIGQVAENVYDTATGGFLLIPQGTRLMGRYDNTVSMGQTRVGVVWTRLIYPDASSIDLGSMEGADQGGYAGFHDQVNTHFWSKISNALLISIAGAGVQLSQPQAVNGQNYNSQQIAAAALGQQFGELGQEYALAGLSVPNTLEIRPGYRFVVMVNKDMHLRPYVDRRSAAAAMPGNFGPVLQ
jgi:type IV secretion system protein VirB10